jgi:sulfite exporter TauE/SafE
MLALPFENNTWLNRFISNGIYFLGKALTYAIMGFAIGLMGAVVFPKGFQQWVSIGTGVLILIMTWLPKLFKSNSSNAFNDKVIQTMSAWMKKRGTFAQFVLGLLNGLLPCGLVYMALAASITAGGAWQSALFMFVFGWGTVPLLFLIGISKQSLNFKYRARLNKAVPYVTTVLALLFILRGLSLGIPFLSPDMEKMEKMGKKGMMPKSQTEQMHSEAISKEALCH